MNKEFVMRGKTASGEQEVLNFSGNTPGYAYRMTEFNIYPSQAIGTSNQELTGSVTAAKTYEDPANPNFNNEGLIATANLTMDNSVSYPGSRPYAVVNDTFLITQDLILAVADSEVGGPKPVNWQCRFVAEKLNNGEEAVTNFRQFNISSD
jgi:hypothetical protein